MKLLLQNLQQVQDLNHVHKADQNLDQNHDNMKKTPILEKISSPCKAAAKRKFKVWPSAYASGWGVRCTRAGGPGKMGKSKKK